MCRFGIVFCVVFSTCLANFVSCSPAATREVSQEVQISPSTQHPARGFNFWNALLSNSGVKKTVKPVIVYQKPATQENVVYVPYPYPTQVIQLTPAMVPAKDDKAEENEDEEKKKKEAEEKKKKEAEKKKKKEAEEKKKKEAEEKKKKEAEERIRKLRDQLRESQDRQRELLEQLIKEYGP